MTVYQGIIGYTDPDGEYHHLGSLEPKYGESRTEMERRLYDTFWDARLDSVGASPSYYISEAEPDEEGRITLSFGVMPTWREFARNFKLHCPAGVYNITTGVGGEDGLQRAMDAAGVRGDMLGYRDTKDFTARELYDVLMHLKEDWSDAEDEGEQERYEEGTVFLASSIMDTLGYEWV